MSVRILGGLPASLKPGPHPLWHSSQQMCWNLFGGMPACGERDASHALHSASGTVLSILPGLVRAVSGASSCAWEGIAQVTSSCTDPFLTWRWSFSIAGRQQTDPQHGGPSEPVR